MTNTTINHPKKAEKFLKDKKRVQWHNQTLWHVREKRDKIVNQLPEWEELRNLGAQIKQHTLTHLDHYLEKFEKNAIKNGIKVHWANDAQEHNEIVLSIIKKHQAKKVVKSKSMLTEECHLNPYLATHNISVIDTDLGERIVQMRKEPPSHIVLPAIHTKREEIAELFHEQLGSKNNPNPTYLTKEGRKHLRQVMLQAEIGITGVNFAIAETGGIVICTNEGNADLGTALPKVHIACMGLEKIIPKQEHLAIFTRLLARSATGQPITSYTSHINSPQSKNKELHIVLVDNNRSSILGKKDFYKALSCIRCGACINTCPVYRRSGGHSYGFVSPGPIGAVLAPHYNLKKYSSLPYASSLCGSCTDVCPVKINLHEQLILWRKRIAKSKSFSFIKKLGMKSLGKIFASNILYSLLSKSLSLFPSLSNFMANRPLLNKWAKQRKFPNIPKKSFKKIYKQRKANAKKQNFNKN